MCPSAGSVLCALHVPSPGDAGSECLASADSLCLAGEEDNSSVIPSILETHEGYEKQKRWSPFTSPSPMCFSFALAGLTNVGFQPSPLIRQNPALPASTCCWISWCLWGSPGRKLDAQSLLSKEEVPELCFTCKLRPDIPYVSLMLEHIFTWWKPGPRMLSGDT